MKYFKIITQDTANMDGESPDKVGDKIKASEKMHKDGISRLFAPFNKRELTYFNQKNKNALSTKN